MKKLMNKKNEPKSKRKVLTISFEDNVINDDEKNAPTDNQQDKHLGNEQDPKHNNQDLKHDFKKIDWIWKSIIATIVAIALLISVIRQGGGVNSDQSIVENLVEWALNDEWSTALYCILFSFMQK